MSAHLVHVVEDDGAVLRSFGRLLRSAGHEAFLYETPDALLGAIETLAEGCILLDIRMPQMDGLMLLRELRLRRVDLPVIIMTGYADLSTVIRANALGATEFLEKPIPEEKLFRAIEAAEREAPTGRYNPGTNGPIIKEALGRVAALSRREREVLEALAQGDTQKVIAYDLGISVRTVEVHRARMLRRLGVRNLAQAIGLAAIADLGVTRSADAVPEQD